MEKRKQREIEYYDKEANNISGLKTESGNLMHFDPFLLESYQFLKDFLSERCQDKTVLDYGCGTGIHLLWLSKIFKEVAGIDLSPNSIREARKIVMKKGLKNVKLFLDDCENMPFANDSFDLAFDGGTFSSLDLKIALKEIHRVLKPGGILIGIETLGHNPLTNLKRKLNEILGKRTEWAAGHIFKVEDLKEVKKYFTVMQVKFFHLASWIAFPFLNLPGGKFLLKTLEKLDRILLLIFPFLKKYSFKILFVFKKNDKAII